MKRKKKIQAIPPVPTIGPPAASAAVPSEAPPEISTAELPSPAEPLPENPLGDILLYQVREAEEFQRLMTGAK